MELGCVVINDEPRLLPLRRFLFSFFFHFQPLKKIRGVDVGLIDNWHRLCLDYVIIEKGLLRWRFRRLGSRPDVGQGFLSRLRSWSLSDQFSQ